MAPFSHGQKLELAAVAAKADFAQLVHSVGYTPMLCHGQWWPFNVLDRKPGTSDAAIIAYASLFYEAAPSTVNPFGELKVMYPADIKSLPLRIAAAAEWEAIRASLLFSLATNEPTPPPLHARSFDATPGAHLRRNPGFGSLTGPNAMPLPRGRREQASGSSAVRERTGRE